MSHHRLALIAAGVLVACPPPVEPSSPTLTARANPSRIDDRGQTSTLTFTARTAEGNPGTGTVSLTAAAGTLSSTTVTLEMNGAGTATFSCDAAAQMGCSGNLTVEASWNGVTTRVRIFVGAPPDGGLDGGDDDGGMTSSDAGPHDAGMSDAGPPLFFDAGSVLLLGTFVEGQPVYSISDMAPDAGGVLNTDDLVMLPPKADLFSAVIRPSGTLLYLDIGPPARLFEASMDLMRQGQDGGAQISVLPDLRANDLVVPTPACEPGQRFWVRPDTGSVVYLCDSTYYEGADPVPAYTGLELLALGPNGLALGRSDAGDVVRDDGGTDTPISGFMGRSLTPYINNQYIRNVRASPTGFLLVLGQAGSDFPPCELWSIDANGAAANLGAYATLAPDAGITMATPCEGKLDDARALWSLARRGTTDVVVVRPFGGGAASIVYSDPDGGPSRFDQYPASLFTFIDPNVSRLVTGP